MSKSNQQSPAGQVAGNASSQSFTEQIDEALSDHAAKRITLGALFVRSLVGFDSASTTPLSKASLVACALEGINLDMQNAANADEESTPGFALSSAILHCGERMTSIGCMVARLLDEAAASEAGR